MSLVSDAVMRTFDYLRTRKRAYQLTFQKEGPSAFVFRDLIAFSDQPFSSDPMVQARNAGRREVVQRIQKHLSWSSQQLFDFYSGQAGQGDKTQ